MFFFKKRKIVLDLFTCRQQVFDTAKPKNAAQFYPEWWKQLPRSVQMAPSDMFPIATMRRCMGMVDHYRHGFIVPLWSDLAVELAPQGYTGCKAQFSDCVSTLSTHVQAARGAFLPETHFSHLKLEAPWAAKCSEDVHFTWEQPTWSMWEPDKYVVLPGTVEYKYQYSLNANLMFIKGPEKRRIDIKHGQPIAHITPLSERDLELRYHMVTSEEYGRMMQGEKISNLDNYRIYRRARESEERKCPFGGTK